MNNILILPSKDVVDMDYIMKIRYYPSRDGHKASARIVFTHADSYTDITIEDYDVLVKAWVEYNSQKRNGLAFER